MIFHGSKFDFLRQKCTKIRSKIACKMAWLIFAAKTLQDASKTLTRRAKKLSDLPQDAPQTPQDASKTPPRRPKTTPRRPQAAPRRPQDGPKPPPRRPQDGPRRPKTPQDPPKTLPSHPKPPPDNDFGTILGSLLKIFGRFLGRICRPTCLLKLTFQKGNYLKKDENFAKEHIQIILHTRARFGVCRRHLDNQQFEI